MAAMVPGVVVVADGDLDGALLATLLEPLPGATERPLLIAADGAAGKALAAGVRPDIVIGDGDSLTAGERARLESLGVELRWADPDKDESDTELCLLAALGVQGARITILGALGGDRPEHAVANLLLLADRRLDGRDVEILDGGARLWRIGSRDGPGVVSINGSAADYISLFPLGGAVEGVRSVGLRFGLAGERLELGPSRGLSNEMIGDEATVTTESGCLLLVHTARSATDPAPLRATPA